MADGYFDFGPGAAGNVVYTADKAALDLTGGVEIVAKIKPESSSGLNDWSPGATQVILAKGTATTPMYQLELSNTGALVLSYYDTVLGVQTATSTVSCTTVFKDGEYGWVRARLDGVDTTFWTGGTGISPLWTQLGSVVSNAAGLSGTDGNPVQIGRKGTSSNPFRGFIFYVELKSVGGSLAALCDFRDTDQGDWGDCEDGGIGTPVADGFGNNWYVENYTALAYVDPTPQQVEAGLSTLSAAWTTTPDPYTVTHPEPSSPEGILVLIWGSVTTDVITGVTYGGVAMTRIGRVTDTSEAASVYAYLLGSGVPTGSRTVSIDHTAGSDTKRAVIVSLHAAGNVEVAVEAEINTTTSTNPQATLNSGTDITLRLLMIASGLAAPSSLVPIADMTTMHDYDFGTRVMRMDRQTAATAGSVTVGYTAASDDWCMYAVAIRQTSGPQTIPVVRASEVETARPVVAVPGVRVVTVGAAAEAETALPVKIAFRVPVGTVAETETARPVGKVVGPVTIPVGTASESETARTVLAVPGVRVVPVGAAAEVEAARPVVPVPGPVIVPVSATVEAEAARPVGTIQDQIVGVVPTAEAEQARPVEAVPGTVSVAVSAAVEVEEARPVGAVMAGLVRPVVAAAETEGAYPVAAVAGPVTVLVVAAAEVEQARTVGGYVTQTVPVVATAEVETALTVATVVGPVSVPVGSTVEAETARPVEAVPGTVTVPVGPTAESETAGTVLAVPGGVTVPVGAAAEAESAGTVGVWQAGAPQTIPVGPTVEAETAGTVEVAFDQAVPVGRAAESETALTVTPIPGTASRTVGVVSETDTAHPVAVVAGPVSILVVAAGEAETAGIVGALADQTVSVGGVVETETGGAVTVTTSIAVTVGPAGEVEVAYYVVPAGDLVVTVGRATESETANPVRVFPEGAGWWQADPAAVEADPVAYSRLPTSADRVKRTRSTPW